jgi:hypothetical protein
MLMARERYQLLWDSLNASRGYSWDVKPVGVGALVPEG